MTDPRSIVLTITAGNWTFSVKAGLDPQVRLPRRTCA
jgi:hypothetical protein